MTPERFQALSEAYGGDVARWPADARDQAGALMAAGQAHLVAAAALDDALDAYPPLAVSHALREAIIASAPALRPRSAIVEWLFRTGLTAGLAAACAAGLVVGVQLSEPTAPDADAITQAMSGYDELIADDTAEGA